MKRKDFKRIAAGNRVIASFMNNGFEFDFNDAVMLEFNYHSDFGSMFNVLNKLSEYVEVECELKFPIEMPDDLSDLYDSVVSAIKMVMETDTYLLGLDEDDVTIVINDMTVSCSGNCNGCSCK